MPDVPLISFFGIGESPSVRIDVVYGQIIGMRMLRLGGGRHDIIEMGE